MLIDSNSLRKMLEEGLEIEQAIKKVEGLELEYLVDEIGDGPINGGVLEKIMVESDETRYEIPMKVICGNVVLRGRRVLEGKVIVEKGQKWFVVERKVEEIET